MFENDSNKSKFDLWVIKSILNSSNAWYHSVQKHFSSCLRSKTVKSRIYRNVILPVALYVCETLFPTLRDKHRLRMFLNRVQRRIFGPKNDKIIDGWRQLCNEELHKLYFTRNTGRFFPLLSGSRLCASRRPVHHRLRGEAHMNFADESVCLMSHNVCNYGKLLILWTAWRHYVSRRAVRFMRGNLYMIC
jgi:hypothetical protein